MEQKLRHDKNIGANLRRLRLQHGFSQEKLCAKLQLFGCDIIRSEYGKYERAELNIPTNLLVTLKKLYNCAYDDFFEGLDTSDNSNQ